ncbi:general transcription factor [Lithospermum erythrorhizon]|uniref:General transcription factor n=1 Tax=Lithospermum erythrorhizon TaxID=34254 RepID=A0AAV3RFT1_LITER
METPPAPPPEQPIPPPQSTPEPPPPSTQQPSEAPQPPIETHLQDPPPSSTTTTPPPPTITTTTTSSTPSLPRLPTPTSTPSFSRPWQPPPQPTLPTSAPQLPVQGGSIAIGVPAHHPTPLPPPSSAFNTPPFGYPRNLPDSIPTSTTSQVRQPIQGIGITGSLGASSTVRPSGVPRLQLRAMQPPVGPPSGINMQPPTTQTFQGHGMFRGQSLGPSGSSAANTGQALHPQNQPWLSSAPQGKSPLPPPSIRPQMNPQSVQQRAHIPQQKQQIIPTTMQQQQAPSQVKQISNPSQPIEQLPQQYPPPRAQLSVPHQQLIGKSQGLGIQGSSSLGVMQAGADHSDPPNRISIEENEEPCNRILSKRTIQELVNQIDPSEKLEPEVEDILVDIAEDFVESITTFGCSLAKHRKSTVLEAKDILLHVERNWNMTLPGFGGDEIKIYKKPLTNDLHKERLAVIKKSIVASESTNAKNSAGQAAGGNTKSHSAKGSANMLGSPNT